MPASEAACVAEPVADTEIVGRLLEATYPLTLVNRIRRVGRMEMSVGA